ncbi:MAG TPA: DNRLRE domain-containing protein [Mariniphaga sp.]|nr:DNRLRE domain-containing protein [Mariniphaga sp.]
MNLKTSITILFFLFLYTQASPQTQRFYATEDVFIRGGNNSNRNYNIHVDGLAVKQGTVSDFFRKSLLKFDISSFSLEKAGSAMIKLYCYKIDQSEIITTIDAYLVSANWNETTVTWSNSPAFDQIAGSAIANAGSYIDIDVSDYVKEALANNRSEISFGLFDKGASNNGIFFYDKTGVNPPELIISEYEDTKQKLLTGTFYIDAENGNDSNNGNSESEAWKTLEHINQQNFGPGTRLLFKSGQSWSGSLQPNGTGAEGKPFFIGSYGEGDRPAIHGNGTAATIHICNAEYFVLHNLEITNYNDSEENGLQLKQWEDNNITHWLNADNPPQYTSGNTMKTGVRITVSDMGEVSDIHLNNLHVHAVNGAINQNSENTKNNGGIFIEITGTDVPTWFNGLLVENCHIHDVDRTGLSNTSSWSKRTLTANENWTPSLNVVIKNNIFERAGANALIVRVAKDPLIENNLFHQNGIKGSGNAAFNFNTDGALWQFNESRFTKKNQNDADAGGIDSDYRSKNTIIQYNYIHNNDFGMLVTGGPSNYGGFNDSTIIRYNIFERDGLVERDEELKFAFKISGKATNTIIHNNVFYLAPEQSDVKIAYHRNWGGNPDNTSYYNNIFYLEGINHGYEFGNSTSNNFSNNLFYGNSTINWPSKSMNIIGNPQFVSPGNGTAGYKITENSVAIKQGIIKNNVKTAEFDYYGNILPKTGKVDIGIHQKSSLSTGELLNPEFNNRKLKISPIPVKDDIYIAINKMSDYPVSFYLVGMKGENIYLGSNKHYTGGEIVSFKLSGFNLIPGIYALKVLSEEIILSEKFIYSGQ